MKQTKDFIKKTSYISLSLCFNLLKLIFPFKVFAQEDIIGNIEPPPGVAEYNDQAGGEIGIVIFMSNLIRLATVVAGIWTMINFILAGYLYITSGEDSGKKQQASQKMTMSIIGLVVITMSYTIAALIGLIIFGDASFIINPQLQGIIE